MAEVVSDSDARATALDIVSAVRGREPSLDDIITSRIHDQLNESSQDPEMQVLLRASVEGNTALLQHMLMSDLDTSMFRLSAASTEYAHRLARKGIPTNVLLSAYQVGHQTALATWHEELERRELSDALARRVGELLSRQTLACVTWITSAAMEAYEDERLRLTQTGSHDVAAAVRAVLAGREFSSEDFARRTGYALNGRHLGLRLWTAQPIPGDAGIQELARRFLAKVCPQFKALVLPVDSVTAQAWLMIPDHVPDQEFASSVAESIGVRVAAGQVLAGREGFVRTMLQAQAAAEVSVCRPLAPAVQRWSEPGVALASILLSNFDATRMWVNETLGPLAEQTEDAALLRDTLWVFLTSNRSWILSAERLHLHRNSVRYRVGRAIALLGVSDHNEIPPDVSTALQVTRLLGDGVLELNPAM